MKKKVEKKRKVQKRTLEKSADLMAKGLAAAPRPTPVLTFLQSVFDKRERFEALAAQLQAEPVQPKGIWREIKVINARKGSIVVENLATGRKMYLQEFVPELTPLQARQIFDEQSECRA